MRQDNDVRAGRTKTLTQKFASLTGKIRTTPIAGKLTNSKIRERLNVKHAAALGLATVATAGVFAATAHTGDSPAKPGTIAAATSAQIAADHATKAPVGKADPKAPAKAAAPAKAPVKPAAPVKVTPVAGLDQTQMDNAVAIVKAGKALGISERGQIVAISTAMQESKLYNLASYVVPESLKYAHQGTGADYDSVGLFQQRYTTGWGTVAQIMNPTQSATSFYQHLKQVDGWQTMPITVAAQTVQGSAFPDAYAQWQAPATTVVQHVNATIK
jgi:hypothetical protein